MNIIAASRCFGLETIEFSRVFFFFFFLVFCFFFILYEQPSQQCKIDLSTTTKIPEFFYLYDRGM